MSGASGESTPPATIVFMMPVLMCRNAYPIASVDEVQPVDTMWLSPRNPKRIETSLASVPIVPVGIVYTLHCLIRPA